MSFFVVDVESDGPAPGLFSMVSFGAVLVTADLNETFYGETQPISDNFDPKALSISNTTRKTHLTYEHPEIVMKGFAEWVDITTTGRPIFISDNPAFDWQFINYYFHKFVGYNPFGFSARRIGDLYCGMQKDAYKKWKHLRKTKHTHHPVDDAKGNAEVLLSMKKMGLKIDLI